MVPLNKIIFQNRFRPFSLLALLCLLFLHTRQSHLQLTHYCFSKLLKPGLATCLSIRPSLSYYYYYLQNFALPTELLSSKSRNLYFLHFRRKFYLKNHATFISYTPDGSFIFKITQPPFCTDNFYFLWTQDKLLPPYLSNLLERTQDKLDLTNVFKYKRTCVSTYVRACVRAHTHTHTNTI